MCAVTARTGRRMNHWGWEEDDDDEDDDDDLVCLWKERERDALVCLGRWTAECVEGVSE